MTFYRRPRVFLSYRHREKTLGDDAEEYNVKHYEWVRQLANDLESWGIEVIYDGKIRKLLDPIMNYQAASAPITADAVVGSIAICHAFLPIITPGYLDRIGYGNYQNQLGMEIEDGYVLEEWQIAMANIVEGKIEYIPIIREGSLGKMELLPLGINKYTTFDLRDGAPYEDTVEQIGDRLQLGLTVEKPPLDMSLHEYLNWFLNEINKHKNL